MDGRVLTLSCGNEYLTPAARSPVANYCFHQWDSGNTGVFFLWYVDEKMVDWSYTTEWLTFSCPETASLKVYVYMDD